MHLQELAAAVGEDDAAVAFIERDRLHQPLVAKVVETVRPRIELVVAQVAFRDNAKGANGREIPSVSAVQLVRLIVVPHHFAVEAARQI